MILGAETMVEEIVNIPEGTTSNYPKKKTQTSKPRAVYLWTVADVLKWYKRHCGDFLKYYEFFQMHEITGRTLLRITDNSLERMGITDNKDREAIWREILKQKLKTDIMEIRDLELMNECPF